MYYMKIVEKCVLIERPNYYILGNQKDYWKIPQFHQELNKPYLIHA